MGISGLLPLMREAQRPGHIKEFSGQTVGVDSYIWLYRGAFSCAADLVLGKPTDRYVKYFMARAKMLRHFGVEPFFVFDGGILPAKQGTEQERQRSRTERKEKGIRLWNQSKKRAAYDMFQKCIEATPEMARAVIDELKQEGFKYVVAPYEADAQLAYLQRTGVISAAISEDSDLIVFGCEKLILKLDQYGAATIFDRSKLHAVKSVDISGWSDQSIRRMCILSGCDYLPSIPGIGLKRAHKYVNRSATVDVAVSRMRADGFSVPADYVEKVQNAELTFLYQIVYDPTSQKLAHTSPLSDDAPSPDQMPFIGCFFDPEVATAIAQGELNPITLEPLAGANTNAQGATDSSSAKRPASRKPSLLSFLVRPKKPKQPSPPAPPSSESQTKASSPPVERPSSAEGDETIVQVKFRRSVETNTKAVVTHQHSKFFGKSVAVNVSTEVCDEVVVDSTQSTDLTKVGESQDLTQDMESIQVLSQASTAGEPEGSVDNAVDPAVKGADESLDIKLDISSNCKDVSASDSEDVQIIGDQQRQDSTPLLSNKMRVLRCNSGGSASGRKRSSYSLFEQVSNKPDTSEIPKEFAFPVYRKDTESGGDDGPLRKKQNTRQNTARPPLEPTTPLPKLKSQIVGFGASATDARSRTLISPSKAYISPTLPSPVQMNKKRQSLSSFLKRFEYSNITNDPRCSLSSVQFGNGIARPFVDEIEDDPESDKENAVKY